ncbi:hypothetical protein ACTA71_006561 [Dictyostelium dimigraforme]
MYGIIPEKLYGWNRLKFISLTSGKHCKKVSLGLADSNSFSIQNKSSGPFIAIRLDDTTDNRLILKTVEQDLGGFEKKKENVKGNRQVFHWIDSKSCILKYLEFQQMFPVLTICKHSLFDSAHFVINQEFGQVTLKYGGHGYKKSQMPTYALEWSYGFHIGNKSVGLFSDPSKEYLLNTLGNHYKETKRIKDQTFIIPESLKVLPFAHPHMPYLKKQPSASVSPPQPPHIPTNLSTIKFLENDFHYRPIIETYISCIKPISTASVVEKENQFIEQQDILKEDEELENDYTENVPTNPLLSQRSSIFVKANDYPYPYIYKISQKAFSLFFSSIERSIPSKPAPIQIQNIINISPKTPKRILVSQMINQIKIRK